MKILSKLLRSPSSLKYSKTISHYSKHRYYHTCIFNKNQQEESNNQGKLYEEKIKSEYQLNRKLGELSSKALTFEQLNKFDEALKVHYDIIKLKPNSVFAHIHIGHILYFNNKNRKGALHHFEKVIEYTTIHYNQVQSPEVEEIMELAINYQPKANYFIAKIYLEEASEVKDEEERKNKLQKALTSINEAIQLLTNVQMEYEIPPETFQPLEELKSEIESSLEK